ncbi:TniB family NTP-binding protein [Nocardioides conyzicola]|uniref:AAA+ ATPase domain-containing protein n=1 Tax=Nocardioides conyzicola TaxID=1651781 RepID=A0ABP8XAJ0_9ACTN
MTLSLDPSDYVDLRKVEKLDISDLDGWKTFVRLRNSYHAPPVIDRSDYQSLAPRERLKYDTIRRLGNFNPPKHETPMTAAIREQVQPVLQANLYRMDPGVRSGIFISADGAMGKSTLMREIAADYEAAVEVVREVMPSAVSVRDRWVPVAWVTVPPKLSIKSLATAILTFYGEPVRSHMTDSALTQRVVEVLRDCGTRLLVLDDITRYKDGEADRLASDWIRNLMETSVTVVAMGVDVRGSGILYDGTRGRDKQLRTQTARRFTILDIEPFRYDTSHEIRAWVEHLAAVEADLPLLDKSPGMLSKNLAEFLYDRTQGVIGVLADWVQLTAETAIGRDPSRGGEYLTRDDFERIPVKGTYDDPENEVRNSVRPTATKKRKGRNTVFDQPSRSDVA